MLAKNGRMVIEVPSSEDVLLTLYDAEAFQRFTYWSQHLYLFNAETLRRLAEQAGLRKSLFSSTNAIHSQITCIGSARTNQVAIRNGLFWTAQN